MTDIWKSQKENWIKGGNVPGREAKILLPSVELGPSLRFYSRQHRVFIELSPFFRWQWLAATGPSDHLEAAVALDYISASNGPALQFGARLSLGL